MRALLLVALIGVLVAGDPVHAQAGPRLTVQSVVVSADTVGIGDRFDLTLTVDLAPRSVAFFPDASAVANFGIAVVNLGTFAA